MDKQAALEDFEPELNSALDALSEAELTNEVDEDVMQRHKLRADPLCQNVVEEPREAHVGLGALDLLLEVLSLLFEVALAGVVANEFYLLLAVLRRQLQERIFDEVLEPQLGLLRLCVVYALIDVLLPHQVLLLARTLRCKARLDGRELGRAEAARVHVNNRFDVGGGRCSRLRLHLFGSGKCCRLYVEAACRGLWLYGLVLALLLSGGGGSR